MVKANLSIYQNIADCIAGRGGGGQGWGRGMQRKRRGKLSVGKGEHSYIHEQR